MAISAARLQFMLAQTPYFMARVQIIMVQVAGSVLAETGVGEMHSARAAYAKFVLANGGAIPSVMLYIAQSTNVAGTITMEDEGPRSSVTDAALLSQIAADWNKLAGLDTGN